MLSARFKSSFALVANFLHSNFSFSSASNLRVRIAERFRFRDKRALCFRSSLACAIAFSCSCYAFSLSALRASRRSLLFGGFADCLAAAFLALHASRRSSFSRSFPLVFKLPKNSSAVSKRSALTPLRSGAAFNGQPFPATFPLVLVQTHKAVETTARLARDTQRNCTQYTLMGNGIIIQLAESIVCMPRDKPNSPPKSSLGAPY